MSNMQVIRDLLMRLNDEQLLRVLGAGTAADAAAPRSVSSPAPEGEGGFWFDRCVCGLSREGRKRLRELEQELNNPAAAPHVDKRLVRYSKQFMRMRMKVPDFFRERTEPRALYQRLSAFCREHDIPAEIAERIVPPVIEYIRTGHMRPVMFIGEKGCGKTTAVKLLVQEALGLPTEVIKVPQTDGSHGMTGDCSTYRSADVGAIAKAQLRHNSLIVAYVFDEIDKVTHGSSRADVDDELLSITDESRSEVIDNFMECPLTALEHCPMFFTGNDLGSVNPILADRCTVIHFPPADAQRIKSVMRKYAQSALTGAIYSEIGFDFDLMDQSIDNLVQKSVTSLRKHQQLIENVLGLALHEALNRESGESVSVTKEMFDRAEREVCAAIKRRTGFGA